MTAAAFHKIKRGLLEALDIAQAGDEEIADRLTREQAAQDAIRDRIAAQTQRAQEAAKPRCLRERRR
ncbi:hypothetical protein [Asaia spathodeae]|uniref:Uncharacterized protein n=1 Tax=Asaia spathodeae TaxID=657016 RepID=A0ABX2P6F0_9PROT|nr:hypothetical protein [Asaia spathodeae]GBR19725.1 hypothetical protein AA105894_2382 [Asaia spathodeae NBRC 105894]